MLKEKIEEIYQKLNSEHKIIKTMKIYSNNVPINEKLTCLQRLPVKLRGAASLVYDALEGHVNGEFGADVSQETLSAETGYSREWVNYIISKLSEIGLIEKTRRGLKQVNHYCLIVKKALMDKVSEIKKLLIEIQKEKKANNSNKGTFNAFKQRDYEKEFEGGYKGLEQALLGWTEGEELEDYPQTE